MKKSLVKLISMLLCMMMVMAALTGCGGEKGSAKQTESVSTNTVSQDKPAKPELPLLEYTCFIGSTNPVKTVDNANDVVTPYVEEKFKIKVKEVIQPQSSVLPKEKLNMLIAANNVPDVMVADGEFATYAVSTGKFMEDLGPYISEMKNYNKYFDENMWGNFKSNGKVYSIPYITASKKTDDMFKADPFYSTFSGWAFWVREDILAKAGYKFTPLDELKANITDQGKKLTLDDLKIEPAIDTPEKWVEMLRKFKELGLKVGDKPVIPLSIASWNQWHIGNMVGLSQWKIDNNTVSGYIGCPEAKDWYKLLWNLYKEGILDKDFIIHKDDLLQEKIASGRVAAGMFIPNRSGAIDNLKKISPDANIRYIPWPKEDQNKGSFDVMQGGFWRIIINKDFKDVKRLTQYFDWFYSDEGLDIITWGPESAGLWEMKDGKKVFKDQQLADALINGGAKEGTKGPEYYGLYTPYSIGGGFMSFNSKAANCAPVFMGINPVDSRHSYPVKFDIYNTSQTLCGSNGINKDGTAAYGDGGPNTSAVATYYWGKFQNDRVGKVFAAKTEEDFEKAWEEQYNLFVKETKYNDAVKDMENFFANTLKK